MNKLKQAFYNFRFKRHIVRFAGEIDRFANFLYEKPPVNIPNEELKEMQDVLTFAGVATMKLTALYVTTTGVDE